VRVRVRVGVCACAYARINGQGRMASRVSYSLLHSLHLHSVPTPTPSVPDREKKEIENQSRDTPRRARHMERPSTPGGERRKGNDFAPLCVLSIFHSAPYSLSFPSLLHSPRLSLLRKRALSLSLSLLACLLAYLRCLVLPTSPLLSPSRAWSLFLSLSFLDSLSFVSLSFTLGCVHVRFVLISLRSLTWWHSVARLLRAWASALGGTQSRRLPRAGCCYRQRLASRQR